MTSALEVESHDTATSQTAAARTDEGIDQIFSFRELARIDEALTMSSRETGLRFTLYVGDLGTPTRARAEELHAYSGGNTAEAVLIAVSPGQRVVEVVTGSAAARRLPDRACALAVLSMTTAFAGGDLVGGIVNGLRQLSDQAGRPSVRHGH
ncbi:TLP18.3, Psb32 and MOLO-1 founding protein of phosphatase [Blastococcus aurantiacus]|uniref:TLP18.3, Psb32 and MOLO-1 founding protein of phosphatase n=1 Tax=Blastococcus aurantiacus TaxID=1550231 RepID=A0A1G7LG27_9ACTN|nr:DUF5130 family protein [Blastococcus aurantiacus]SDF48371.1 TLP18.3, Psb32 and MOLO-1 founding protein of phosphatase [Blastococcus aurantiacus]